MSLPDDGRRPFLPAPCMLGAFALVVANTAFLAVAFRHGYWLIDGDGHGTFIDFVNVWAAGQLALEGHAAAAYDWTLHKLAQEAALHRPLVDFFPWFYPPTFFAVAAVLGLLPYLAALIAWLIASFTAYVLALRAIIGRNAGILLASALPAVVANAMVGQNGFLTAALFGGALHLLTRSPAAAGILLGALTYKPHFGILIPLALALGGHWRVFIVATATTVAVGSASLWAFGIESWTAFGHALPLAEGILANGSSGWNKLHSFYAVVRFNGGSESVGWTVQAIVMGAAAIGVGWLWRSRTIPYEVRAAGLGVGALLVTPYLFIYDLVLLAVPMAFLIRIGLASGFRRGELLGLAAANVALLFFVPTDIPVGLIAILIVAILVARRALLREEAPLAPPLSPDLDPPNAEGWPTAPSPRATTPTPTRPAESTMP